MFSSLKPAPRACSQVRADAARARVHARAALPDAREEEGAPRLAPAEAHAVEHLALVPGVLALPGAHPPARAAAEQGARRGEGEADIEAHERARTFLL